MKESEDKIVSGFDPASPDGDWCAECEVKCDLDGAVKVLNFWIYRKTIEGDPAVIIESARP